MWGRVLDCLRKFRLIVAAVRVCPTIEDEDICLC